ncbi:MAG: DUF5672 family protein [Tannerellaceae bacterium]
MNYNKSLIIIIPIYTTKLNNYEIKSFEQCVKVLHRHNICIICPEGLDVKQLPLNIDNISISYFPAHFFDGITGYNKFMLSPNLYNQFIEYKYILIYQLDCFVFSDSILQFCEYNYDYIGAPWLPKKINFIFKHIIHPLKRFIFNLANTTCSAHRYYKVGNGGLSLRRTSTFKHITEENKELIESFLKNKGDLYNEDVFISLFSSKNNITIKTPSYEDALSFCIESNPKYAFSILKKMPFGCHAWYKKPYYSFWKDIIQL